MKSVCSVKCINENNVNSVRTKMLKDSVYSDISDIFKVLGDKTRLKILFALSKKELCVCDLCSLLNMEQSAISHQLRLLRNLKLVKCRKDGKIVYYSLYDNHIMNLIKMGVLHNGE
ncbi:MAG: metalloregulator ArsR/SmtB family transcription factor [Candidatus Woesearchaeota archaeon]|nr:metalloregulator ArsR/SmtB family transcription factor [Candidatus Woesearchaeota archaeon]